MDVETECPVIHSTNFFKAVNIFIERPHVVNKRICGVDLQWKASCKYHIKDEEIIEKLQIDFSNLKISSKNKLESLSESLEKLGFIKSLDTGSTELSTTISLDKGCIALIRRVIPKSAERQKVLHEVVVIDVCCQIVYFVTGSWNEDAIPTLPEFSYCVCLKGEEILLRTFNYRNEYERSYKWLSNKLLPTLRKWAKQMDVAQHTKNLSSLQLVDILKYNETYQDLKKKYGRFLTEIWTETTDPLKYIYEDIAIASYLIVLWERERIQSHLDKVSFLDLGCGNGLLVYLLTSEGYPGMGIDIRRRKLWDKFPESVILKENAVLPSDKHLYPEYEWLIGNHSDELTPWLPVIAAKSSINSKFFIIPCCAHDFQGKFQRKKGGISQYSEYLDYVQEIGAICGFEVLKDRLRIPSTKRTCFVGQKRLYSSSKWTEIIDEIDAFIRSKCSSHSKVITNGTVKDLDGDAWCENFIARAPVEKVQNCTHLKTDVREKLVNDIGFLLLSQRAYVKVAKGDEIIEWNKGGKVSMKELAHFMNSQLKYLKNECGGLQTLLRNHSFVFSIEKGQIRLKMPEPIEKRNVPIELLKTKTCWFNKHHPQGCTLDSEKCTYKH